MEDLQKIIKSRVQLIGGTASDWVGKKLLKNEAGIEWEEIVNEDSSISYKLIGVKFGDGVSTWEQLEYFGGAEAQVFSDITLQEGETHEQAIARETEGVDLNVGDIAIIKELIAEDKYSYTAYVYDFDANDNPAWKAMDGNVDADNVYFDSDLTITANIGAQTLPSGQSSAVLATEGKSLEQVMKMILAVEKAPSIVSKPTVLTKIINSQTGTPNTSNISVEGGSTIYPRWNASLSTGSYTYGPTTDITATTWEVTDNRNSIDSTLTNATAASVNTQNFDSLILPAGKTYKITATATHNDGVIAHTNLGEEYKAGNALFDSTEGATIVQILGGTSNKKSDDSPTITAWQQGYYIGSLTDANTEITSEILRGDDSDKALKNAQRKGSNYAATEKTWTFTGSQAKYVVAYPWTVDHNEDGTKLDGKGLIKFFNGTSFEEYVDNFTEDTIIVAGADKDTTSDYAVKYTLYTWSPAAAFDGEFSFTIKLA